MPLAAGFGDGSGVPNMAKPAEPFPVQPGAWWCGRSILVRHHYCDGRFRRVHVEGAAHGNQSKGSNHIYALFCPCQLRHNANIWFDPFDIHERPLTLYALGLGAGVFGIILLFVARMPLYKQR
jgi:hypothetical protein